MKQLYIARDRGLTAYKAHRYNRELSGILTLAAVFALDLVLDLLAFVCVFFLHDIQCAGRIVFIVATVIILGGIIVYLCLSKNRGKWLNTALAFIVSGALGNFIDRIFNNGGYVRDMIHVIIEINGKEYFPYIFNVADIALVVGAIMLIVDMLFIGKDAVFMSKKRRAAIEKDEVATNRKLDEARDLIREINDDNALLENAEAKSADRSSDNYDDLIDDDYSDDESDEKNETKSGDENK